MKQLTQFLFESLAKPKTKEELRKLIENMVKNKNFKELNYIDTSNITDMRRLFEDLDIGDINISNWDVSNVTDMSFMFAGCENFNSDLSNWDVSNVKNMCGMFMGCKNFNCDISHWDVSRVKDMRNAFKNCETQPNWYK